MRNLSENLKKTTSKPVPFFPRIIREFNDGPDEKPMLFGEE